MGRHTDLQNKKYGMGLMWSGDPQKVRARARVRLRVYRTCVSSVKETLCRRGQVMVCHTADGLFTVPQAWPADILVCPLLSYVKGGGGAVGGYFWWNALCSSFVEAFLRSTVDGPWHARQQHIGRPLRGGSQFFSVLTDVCCRVSARVPLTRACRSALPLRPYVRGLRQRGWEGISIERKYAKKV